MLRMRSTPGAATPIINKTAFGGLRLRVPALPVQRRIAGILSAYDDLIENCERRIRVLDEMARALYREWFVLFRYPGHEKTPLVDSPLGRIPNGWEARPLFELATVQYGRNLPKKALSADGRYPVYGASAIIGRHSTYTREERTVICGCRGSVGEMQITEPMCFVTNNAFTFDPLRPLDFYWMFQALSHRGLRDVVGGAAQPQITLDGISSVTLVAPPAHLRDLFFERTAPTQELAWRLGTASRTLRKTRDLLLPRLLSGELSVDDAA